MIYGYARVSSKGQFRDGNGLEDQKEQLLKAGCQTVIEEQFTGTTIERPEFSKLIEKLHEGDTLIVTKLDRFARNAGDGSNLAKELLSKGVNLHILNMGLISNTPIGKVTLNCLLAFAEFERDMIVERTQAGKAIARTKAGYREGRPPINETKVQHAVELIESGHTYKEVVAMTGISKSTIIRAVRKHRATTGNLLDTTEN